MHICDIWKRRTRKHLAIALLLGLILRLFFVLYIPAADVDSDLYRNLAQNIVRHHAYAYDSDSGMVSTDLRVPGYPLFLGALYIFFGDSQRAARCGSSPPGSAITRARFHSPSRAARISSSLTKIARSTNRSTIG